MSAEFCDIGGNMDRVQDIAEITKFYSKINRPDIFEQSKNIISIGFHRLKRVFQDFAT